ncbi:MAG TPA: rod shape-determining protein [Candidatus Angelobacter sp.]|jgi:rod shape-determining protein MreB|nr:rod shape-determining protein [Candidatus Angelobacter sp.]
MLGKKLAIDIGTATLRMQVKGEQPLSAEPSLVAVEEGSLRVVAAGAAASGAVRAGIAAVAPVHDGAIGDMAAYEALLQHAINRGVGRQRIFKPDVMLAVMSAMSGHDRRALMEMAVRVGARTTYLIDAPLAAASGAGLPITTVHGHLIVDAGAGKTDIAVVSVESLIVGRCVRRGGHHLDAAIARHLASAHGLGIDGATAEDVKLEIAAAVPLAEERRLLVPGVDAAGGERGEARVSSTEIGEVVRAELQDVGQALREVLAETPAALLDDIRHDGAVLTGGAARLRGFDRWVSGIIGAPARVAGEPDGCVVRGVATALDNLDVMRRNFLYIR